MRRRVKRSQKPSDSCQCANRNELLRFLQRLQVHRQVSSVLSPRQPRLSTCRVLPVVLFRRVIRRRPPVNMSEDTDDSGSQSALFQNDDLLKKILSYVVGNGICECRRVCRRWREVCRGLPMRLCLAPSTDAPTLAVTFPSAESASFFDVGDSPTHDYVCDSPTEPGLSLVTGLDANAASQASGAAGIAKNNIWPNELQSVLLSMTTLRSLSLTYTDWPEDDDKTRGRREEPDDADLAEHRGPRRRVSRACRSHY